jgi:hypothetical protein
MALSEYHHGRQRVGSAAPSQSRRRDGAGLLTDREVHDRWLVRPRLRWKPEEMHVAYWKRRDNLYRDKSPLPSPACVPGQWHLGPRFGPDCTADRHLIALSRRTTAMLVTDSPALPDGAVYASSLRHEASLPNRQSCFAGADPSLRRLP